MKKLTPLLSLKKLNGKNNQMIIRIYYTYTFANKLDNLGEMDKFLERHKLPELMKKSENFEQTYNR